MAMIENTELAALDRPRTPTPLADSYMRARLGLPADFDLDSVPFGHLEFVAAELQRKANAKAEVERKEAEAEQKRLAALEPPKIIPQFITTASHLKGDRRISGVASTSAINSHNQVVCPGGANIILPVPLLINHDPQKCVGSVEGAQIDGEGAIHIWANLDSRCDAHTWRRIQSGDLRCLSSAVDPKTCSAPVKINGIDHYFSWRLKEISLCEVGANHKCIVTLIYPPISETPPSEIVGHVGQAVETIATQADVVQSINELTHLMSKPMKPVYDKDGKLIGAQRVDKSFEQHEARLAALEDRLPLAYGGTYSDGQGCKKGFFYSFQGSLWYCLETTVSRPGTNADFQLAVKHGAAGKGAR